MADLIIIAVVFAIVISVSVYIVKEKKKGKKCIGCPYGGKCSGNCDKN